jgi:hypothetical protein
VYKTIFQSFSFILVFGTKLTVLTEQPERALDVCQLVSWNQGTCRRSKSYSATLLKMMNHSRLWSWHLRDRNLREHRQKSNSCHRTTTTTTIIGRKKTTRRKKKKRATTLKAKKMKTTLLGATPRRTRCSTMLTRSKLLEMKPRFPPQTEEFAEPHQHHHSARVQNQVNSVPWPRRVQDNRGDHQQTEYAQLTQGSSLQDHLPGCSS